MIVPSSLRKDILAKIHQGHFGMEKCKLRAREVVFWPGMTSQIIDMVSKCCECATYRKAQQAEPLIPHEVPHTPWSTVGMDLFSTNDRDYILLVDYFSKFVEIGLLSGTKSGTVIKQIKSVFARHGIPTCVISDNGPQFRSAEFKTFSQKWEFRHVTSSPGFPQSNGLAERSIQTVKLMLKKCEEDGTDPYLALLSLRNTSIDANLGSPAQLLMGRRLNDTLPVKQSLLQPSLQTDARQMLVQRQQVQKTYHDRKALPLPHPALHPGDPVRLMDPQTHRWSKSGKVEQKCESPRSYIVEFDGGRKLRRNRKHLLKTPEKVHVSPPLDDADDSDNVSNNVSDTPAASPDGDPGGAVITDSSEKVLSPKPITTRSGRLVKQPIRFPNKE